MGARMLGLALALAIATGCKARIDSGEVERQIEKVLAERGIEGGARCPRNIAPKRGGTFQCTAADASGQQLVFDVGMLNDKGRVTINLAGTIVEAEGLLAALRERSGDPAATVTCASTRLVVVEGTPAYCDAVIGGEPVRLEIAETDRAAHIYHWRPVVTGAKAERLIVEMIREHGLAVTPACPATPPPDAPFQCTATVQETGQQLTIDVTPDGAGKINAVLRGTIIDVTKYAETIRRELEARDLTVTCASEVVVVTRAQPAACEVTDGKMTRKLEIVEVDPAKHLVNWRMADADGEFPELDETGAASP